MPTRSSLITYVTSAADSDRPRTRVVGQLRTRAQMRMIFLQTQTPNSLCSHNCGCRIRITEVPSWNFSICCRPSVRLSVCLSVCLSVTLVHPTQPVEIFANVLRHLVPWPPIDIHRKFYGDRPMRNHPSGELNTREVVKYSDFGPIEGYLGNGARWEVS